MNNGILEGTFANGTISGPIIIQKDGNITNGIAKIIITTDNDNHIITFITTINDKTNTDIEKDKFISGIKVTEIKGIKVGSANRNVYEVKEKVEENNDSWYEWHYINITPQEVNKILKVIAPDVNLTVE